MTTQTDAARELANGLGDLDGSGPELRLWLHNLCDEIERLGLEIGAAVAAEREACAALCKEYAIKHAKDDDDSKARAWMMLQCAAVIRARSQEKP